MTVSMPVAGLPSVTRLGRISRSARRRGRDSIQAAATASTVAQAAPTMISGR